ncbi:histone-lysine N-methyltransferase SETDB2 isoform X2 [Scleropages formosus]|uniref:histone-lysine N-methyltransferase SETDB2 isoform X2 n=1 Tax=Scleropages formosus TaxID=113540 RepID=UPI00087904B5|nr:histone-lysine N-methyltransferase SETDB2-like isoform X2 [Scleropages formosus]
MEVGQHEIAKAKEFWSRVDVDHMFSKLNRYLDNVREMIKTHTATDRDYVWSMALVLESEVSLGSDGEFDSIQEAPLSSDTASASLTREDCNLPDLEEGVGCEWKTENHRKMDDKVSESEAFVSILNHPSPHTPLSSVQAESENSPVYHPALQPEVDNHLGPSLPFLPSCHLYFCDPTCLFAFPRSVNHFQGENPLKVPLLCNFRRLLAKPFRQAGEPEVKRLDVLYNAPCGRSMRHPGEVLHFLRETKADGVLRLDNFSFNGDILVERHYNPATKPLMFEKDISKGAEPVPVQLCNEVDEARPEEFRYRKDRWPHGCFVSSIPLFSACCDCQDGCMDTSKCSCLTLSLRGSHAEAQCKSYVPELYTHRRLLEPVPSGIYECGPWCGCSREQCQNRLVQDGLRVRLQVFRTQNRGWGVRCLDDIDRGTFICTYAGALLRAGSPSDESCFSTSPQYLPLKRKWQGTTSDDEVEVVEEWKVASDDSEAFLDTLDAPNLDPASTSSLSHVSVIQGLPDSLAQDKTAELSRGVRGKEFSSCSQSKSVQSQTDLKVEDLEVEESMENNTRLRLKCKAKRTGRTSDTPHTTEDGHSDEDRGQENKFCEDLKEQLYYMDATDEGNVGRFLNLLPQSLCPECLH